MEEILTKYTITEIVIFIVFLAIAIKEVVTFFFCVHSSLKGAFK